MGALLLSLSSFTTFFPDVFLNEKHISESSFALALPHLYMGLLCEVVQKNFWKKAGVFLVLSNLYNILKLLIILFVKLNFIEVSLLI